MTAFAVNLILTFRRAPPAKTSLSNQRNAALDVVALAAAPRLTGPHPRQVQRTPRNSSGFHEISQTQDVRCDDNMPVRPAIWLPWLRTYYGRAILSKAGLLRINRVEPFTCSNCFLLKSENRRLTVSRVVPIISAISS